MNQNTRTISTRVKIIELTGNDWFQRHSNNGSGLKVKVSECRTCERAGHGARLDQVLR